MDNLNIDLKKKMREREAIKVCRVQGVKKISPLEKSQKYSLQNFIRKRLQVIYFDNHDASE